jgi:pimeloyl-ACP methyl ester carboxylesterase
MTGHAGTSTLEVAGASLAYRTVGEGRPLVLVHGSATDMTTWDDVVDELSRDFRVISYDRRGYGTSSHRAVRDHRVHARDLAAVLERVAGAPAAVVGWSSGGNIALATAARRPDLFASLIIVEAPFHGLRHADRHVLATAARLKLMQLRGRRIEAAEVFYRFGTALRSGGNSYDGAPAELRRSLQDNAGPVLAEWDPHPFGVMHEHVSTRSVLDIPVPITWMLGEESAPWMASLRDRLAQRRPSIDTVLIPGAGHLVHLENPTAFVAGVRHGAQRQAQP